MNPTRCLLAAACMFAAPLLAQEVSGGGPAVGAVAAETVTATVEAIDMTTREVVSALFKAAPGSAPDLSGKDLTRLDLAGVDFKRANLAQAKLFGSDLAGANLARANLVGAVLDRVTITKTDFSGANLARVLDHHGIGGARGLR